MNRIKKGVIYLLALAMAMSFLPMLSASAVTVDDFTDIDADHWAYVYVDDVVSRGLFLGTSETTFSPSDPMTRAMFITVLARYAEAETDNNAVTQFSDVPPGQYYTGAVAWGVENEIVTGKSDTIYGTDDPVTREEMVTLIIRFVDSVEITLPQDFELIEFTDAEHISAYATESIERAVKAGVIFGYDDGSVMPRGTSTRAEVATVISRLVSIIAEIGDPEVPQEELPEEIDDPTPPGSDTPPGPGGPTAEELAAYIALREALLDGFSRTTVSDMDVDIGTGTNYVVTVTNNKGPGATLGDFITGAGAALADVIINGATAYNIDLISVVVSIVGEAPRAPLSATDVPAWIALANELRPRPISDAEGMTLAFNFTHNGLPTVWTRTYTCRIITP